MSELFFYSFLGLLLIVTLILNDVVKLLTNHDALKDKEEIRSETQIARYILISSLVLLPLIYLSWPAVVSAGLDNHLMEWLGIVIRWAHVILGIAWIGASFYFIFLENSLNRTKDLRDELAGNLWAIHGGGFYYIEKYKGAPPQLPSKLHWFKYEAYFTWLTGIILLVLVYYLNAKSFMIDPSVSDINPTTAILIGIASLVGGWFIYDWMCLSPLLKKPGLFGLIGFIILVFIALILSKYLSGRAAFMHIGALLGTIMAGNVFFVIIPSQKELVRAARKNMPPDYALGKYAGLRSLHNNYITLPVIFVMISNHFPGTFAPVYNWVILAILTIGSVSVRHYINLHEKGLSYPKFLAFGAVALFAAVFITSPEKKIIDNTPVKFSEVQGVVNRRCITCHSANPTDDAQKVAPNGIMFDTPQQIAKLSDRILFRVVQTKTMPQGNKTGITEAERELLGRWISQGAHTE